MRMLETIREFASARLEAGTEADALRERHASYYESMIVELHVQPGGETAPVSMARLDDDWDDVVACMEWRFVQNDYAQLVRLVSHTWRYMWLRDRFNALMPRLRAAYAARETLEPALRGELCRLWAGGCYQAGRFEEARDANEEAVRLLAETGPIDHEAWARTLLGGLLPYFDGDLERPYAEVSRAVELFRAERNAFGLARTLGMLGIISALLGRMDEAMARFEEGIAVAEQLGLEELIGSHHSLRASHTSQPTTSRLLGATSMQPSWRRSTSRARLTASRATQQCWPRKATSSSPRQRSVRPRASGNARASPSGRSST